MLTRSEGTRRFTRKQQLTAAGFVATLLAVMSLVTGITFGLFSTTTTGQTNTFTTGNVTVGLGSGTSVVCSVTNLAPGDSSTGYPSGSGVADQSFQQCKYFVTYTGSAPAYLAVNVAVNNPTTELYNATSSGLQLFIRDFYQGAYQTTYVGGSASTGGFEYTAQGGTSFGSTLSAGSTASDLLVSTSSYTGSGFTSTFGASGDEFTVDYNLPYNSSSNSNIGGSTTITLTFHAVQAGNNALPSACNSAGAGVSCTGLAWS